MVVIGKHKQLLGCWVSRRSGGLGVGRGKLVCTPLGWPFRALSAVSRANIGVDPLFCGRKCLQTAFNYSNAEILIGFSYVGL